MMRNNYRTVINAFLNEKKLEIKSFEKYVDLFLHNNNEGEEIPRLYQSYGSRWEICVAISPYNQFEQISFVNGITTYQGGKHVEYITNQVTKKLAEYIQRKRNICKD